MRAVFRPAKRPTKLSERTTANICLLIILLSCSIGLPSVYTLRSFISHVPFENSKEQKFLTRVTSCVLGVVPRCRFRRTPRNAENLFDGANFGFTEITAIASPEALSLRLWRSFPRPRDKSGTSARFFTTFTECQRYRERMQRRCSMSLSVMKRSCALSRV